MIWPWLERIDVLEDIKGVKIDKTRFARLRAYIEAMNKLPAVKKTIIPRDKHVYFMREFLAGREPDYEKGLPSTDH